MAYDQGYYQAPQRPYNGRAAQPPTQAFGQGPPPQQYPPLGQYDQYGQDDYGHNGSGNGYTQSYDDQYQQPNYGAGPAPRRQPPPQAQGYPPQQGYYDNGGARSGGDPRSQRSADRGAGANYGRPQPADNRGGGSGGGGGGGGARGYPNSNGPPVNNSGGRPPPLGRLGNSDPGSRRPLAPSQPSPQGVAWDNPFPGFPGMNKKTVSDEDKVAQGIASMDINDSRRQNPQGTKRSPEPRSRGPAGGEPYGRPSGESQRNMLPKGYSPQQGYGPSQGQRPGPGAAFNRPPPQNGYGSSGYVQDNRQQVASTPTSPMNESFGPISRSMTMPNDMSHMANGGPRYPPQGPMNSIGPSAPYNGPVGRGPPRPATAGDNRPPPHRTYPQQAPQQSYSNGNASHNGEQDYSHQANESISDLYDSYYEPEPLDNAPGAAISRRRGMSVDDGYPMAANNRMPPRQQVNGYPQVSQMKSQPDFRAQVQPQSAVYEMAGEAPPVPNIQARGYGYPADAKSQYSHQSQANDNKMGSQGGGQWPDQSEQNNGIPRPVSPFGRGGFGVYNSINSGKPNHDGLPPHPAPVRAGLIPNSNANQANSKPPPVRNYNNVPGSSGAQGQSTASAAKESSAPVTAEEIERLQILLRNSPNDQATQLLLAKKWIEAADVLVPLLPDQKSRTKAREKYIFDAHKSLKKLIAAQNADAMFYMADCYGRGFLGLEPDNKEAFSLYQSAAKAGHAGAAYRTAVCCELGNEEGGGTRKDPLKAIQWYKRAAMLGDPPAMYKMGMIQLKGLLGQPKNPREAIGWLKRAAERADAENPHALHELGLLYESQQPPDGSGPVIRDEAYAFSLFKQAAELGYKFSQFRLGCAYEYGLFNLPIDPRLSIMWYSKAAVQEEHQSELALSGWYLTGSEGVLQQSDTEAYLWARKAAIAGLAKAEYAMGYFTEVGIGAPADFEGAKRWYWRAAAQNFPKARERLEDLKKGGSKPQPRSRERVSRSKIGKQNEGECVVM